MLQGIHDEQYGAATEAPQRLHDVGSYRVDRAWPAHRVAVEADGFQHHGKRLEWKRDRQRIAAIEAMQWRIVHVTWDDVTRQPTQTLDRIAFALGILAA